MFRVASIFSGCGGMDCGVLGGFTYLDNEYERLRSELVYAADSDRSVMDMHNLNFSDLGIIGDIRNEISANIPAHDLLIGGFPCTSFSIVAQNPKRLGYVSEDGQLFFEMCRILKDHKPAAFIAENVLGIFSANNGHAFPLIIQEFEKCGYTVAYKVLDSSHYGVPQRRKRIFIVGFSNQNIAKGFQFPNPISLHNPVPLRVVLEDDNSIEERFFFSQKAIDGLMKSRSRKDMNKGRAQDINHPCNTVGSHLAKVSLSGFDPVLITNGRYRMFTPREIARIQSFPESFKLHQAKTVSYRALGNAVPPVVMWHISKKIFEALQNI